MTDHKVNVEDKTEQADAVGTNGLAPERKVYRVTAEGGMFKRGKQYKTGEKVELDEKTATRALEAGDVEEVK